MKGILCPSVRLSHPFDYVPIIVSSWNFQELSPRTRLCFYHRVLTDPPRIIICLIPFFVFSNRISAIFDPARWSQWDQRWTTSEDGLTLDPIGIKGYFGFTTVYFTHKMTKWPFYCNYFLCWTTFYSFAVVWCNVLFTTMSLPGKTLGPLNGCHGWAHGDSTVTSQWQFVSLKNAMHAHTKWK